MGILFGLHASAWAQTDTAELLQLTPVEISTQRGSYVSDTQFSVGKTPTSFLNQSQVFVSINKEILKNQVAVDLKSALDNATGVSRLWESTGRVGDGASYYSMRGFAVQPTLLNGMPALTQTTVDPANIESIEVIKGPSATLYGAAVTSYGGLININTKKAFNRFAGDISYTLGSFGLNRFQADVNIPINEKVAFRMNAAQHEQGSFQDAGFQKYTFFAPSMRVIASNKWTIYVNAEYKKGRSSNAPMLFLNRYAPLSFSDLTPFKAQYLKSFTSNDLSIETENFNLQAQSWVQISQKWKSQTLISSSQTSSSGYYHYLWDASNGNDFTRFISHAAGQTQSRGIQQNLHGDFLLGSLRNQLLLGLDYFERDIQDYGSAWIANGKVALLTGTDSGILSTAFMNQALAGKTPSNAKVSLNNTAFYLNDLIHVNKNLTISLGIRIDRFAGKPTAWSSETIESQFTQSPRLGIVYKFLDNRFAAFGNYQNGFTYVDPARVADMDGSNPRLKIFDPEQANQTEFGIKYTPKNTAVQVSASVYNIQVMNVVMPDPTNINNSIQGGEVRSEGLELQLSGKLSPHINLIAGFSHNRAEVVKDDAAAGYVGMRPESAGPSNQANAWLHYTTPIKGLSIGAGMNYGSEHFTLNRRTTGTFALPAYTIYNALIQYENEHVGISLKGNNLANTRYYSGWSTVTPQNLRQILASIRFKF